jgi:hypothetical protein
MKLFKYLEWKVPEVYAVSDCREPLLIVDERRLVAVALLKVALFDSKKDEVLLRKHYLPRYQLVLDDHNTLKIYNILFFWEAMPPKVDEAYGIEKME